MKRTIVAAAFLLMASGLLAYFAGVNGGSAWGNAAGARTQATARTGVTPTRVERSVGPTTAPNAAGPAPAESAGPLAPNTSGQIMILMYHRFDPQEGEWNRTPDEFRQDLRRLYEKGYRLVNLRAVLDNKIDLPRGYTPVVLTFDDGWQSQFNYLVNGERREVDPDSAVGILLAFQAEHDDMGLAGTFYVNAEPFGQRSLWREKLRYLVAMGFEIGNHTYTHANLRKSDESRTVKELARLAGTVREALPGYEMDSLALPFGATPRDRTLLQRGEHEGQAYRNRAVLLVGANPAPAPGTPGFDPMSLPRIQANDDELAKWLDYFDRHPEARYVSDGE